MKITCFHKILVIVFMCVPFNTLNAQNDTLFIGDTFEKINLNKISNRYSTNKDISLSEAFIHSFSFKNRSEKFAFFDVNEDFGFLTFSISNKTVSNQKLVIEIYNALINTIGFYEKDNASFRLINESGTDFPFLARLINDRNFLYPIQLNPNETKSYVFQFKKSKISIVVPAKIWNERAFIKQNNLQYLIIGLYFGLCIISILISLYTYTILRKSLYILYAFYIVSLGLYLSSYLGLYFQYLASTHDYYNKYIHVFFTVSTLALFTLFALKVLNSKKHAPKLAKFLIAFLIVTIVIRFSEFIVPKAFFIEIKSIVIRFWYLSIIIMNIIMVLLVIKSYKHQKKITLFFTVAYSFLGLGSIITIINLASGYINAFYYGLPIVFYASFLEIIFLTFTIVFMVKEIYDERNVLSKQLVHQQRQFLSAFMRGEEKERDRIGKELHDNIGSKLSYLKRFVYEKFKDSDVDIAVDDLCNDVRSLSHEISQSELKLVGLVSALSDLAQNYSSGTHLTVEFKSYYPPKNISENISNNLFRIVQEALNNIIKHADASHVDIQLIGHRENITIAIEDDGKGFDFNSTKEGLGLKNMTSRAQQLHGEISIDSKINSGTSVLIIVPL
jgi:signal transduction histidine kinase